MRMFLRKSADRRDPLPVTMTGVRMGERVLQVGVDDPALAGALAARVGLSGHAAMVLADSSAVVRATAAMIKAGALVDVQVAAFPHLPFNDGDFDAVIVHSHGGFLQSLAQEERVRLLRECRRVLRAGGRVVTIEAGERTGLAAMLRPGGKPDPAYQAQGGAASALEAAGFRPVRLLADRDGYRFTEGLNT